MGGEVHSLLNAPAKFGGRECRVSEAWETDSAVFVRVEGDGIRATMTLDAAIQHGVVKSGHVPAALRPVVEKFVPPAPRGAGRRLAQRSEASEAPLRFGRLRSE